ncbi:alginate lyase family protein [Paenibacillus sp. Soil724D2]|uniref:alginate lyase family protein n=1 Tax=Paenibacillus sp. (strain Soil724D2) TaxID=1736392 RepID=UPI00071436D4|nr:alginate lyase family protein [Paenibacillus sp. Soil724D2]KRE49726.1 heparinase [Paenibacillus sp. Soil724D2]
MNYYLTNQELMDAGKHYLQEYPELAKAAIENAEQACKNTFRVPYTMDMDHWVYMGEPIDWLYNPSKDLEFTWVINRHWYMLDLGRAYLITQKEEYVHTFIKHLRGWWQQNPVPKYLSYEKATFFQQPGPWRLLEVGLRVQSWISAFKYMEESPVISDIFREEFLLALVEHANYLTSYLGSTEINHAIMHMQGLFMISVFYHDHPRASFWRQFAIERLELCMVHQIGPDGVQCELTTHYHNGSIEMFGAPYLLGKLSGYPMSEWYANNLRRMGAFTHAMIRPDHGSTAAGDSDLLSSGTERLALLGAILEDEQFISMGEISAEILWMFGSERYETFKKQQQSFNTQLPTTVSFPQTGFYIMKDEQHYVFFDAASMGGAHGHADALNLEWMWKRNLLFLDPGRYTYEEGEWRRYFKSTRAHNTVTVDGLDQTAYVSSQEWGTPLAECVTNRWITGEEYDFIDASHNGYMRLDTPVLHRRWLLLWKKRSLMIIVDWLEGEGMHDIEQRFQLPPSTKVRIVDGGNEDMLKTTVDYASAIQLQMHWMTSSDHSGNFTVVSETGWVSEIYGVKKETSTIVGKGTMTGKMGIVTVCTPIDLKEDTVQPLITRLDIDHRRQEVSISYTDKAGNLEIHLDGNEINWTRR